MENQDIALRQEPSAKQVAIHYDKDRLHEMLVMADQFFRAKCFGSDVQNTQQALVKMQAGFEMGLPPVEAMNSLYIVKGHITMWGMALSKRLRLRGWMIKYDDKEDTDGNPLECTATIKKGEEVHAYKSTAKEVKALNSVAFKAAPKDKLRWHALSRLVRFEVPEIMEAGVAYLAEEMDFIEGEVVNGDLDSDKNPLVLSAQEVLENLEVMKEMKELEHLRNGMIWSGYSPEETKQLKQAFVLTRERLQGKKEKKSEAKGTWAAQFEKKVLEAETKAELLDLFATLEKELSMGTITQSHYEVLKGDLFHREREIETTLPPVNNLKQE